MRLVNVWFLSLLLAATSLATPLPRATYNNPIKQGDGPDPWVLRHGDSYYLTYTGGDVRITRSDNLARWAATGTVVYKPPAPFTDLWAPELHFIQGAFYIYVAMAQNGDNALHRMYVLKGRSTTDPTQPFDLVGQITTPDNNWAIDGTVLIYQNDPNQLYFIWSGWSDNQHQLRQNLCIARMASPTATMGQRVLLHEPNPSWQQSGGQQINEGPEILVHNGRTFLVYSAAGSWTPQYCLALMGIDDGRDPMVPSNWWRLDDWSVMWSSDVAYGPGHASFPFDRNGNPYIVYHANQDPNSGWNGRTIRAEPYTWNPDGSPWFPRPAGFNTQFPLPA